MTFASKALRLEGLLAPPDGESCAVVICHPHPRYGGDMNNPVVWSAARALQGLGAATLRFNFRGVGRSEGQHDGGDGEVDDTRAAVTFLRQRTRVGHLALAGYSFGAVMALRAGHDDPAVDRLIAIAPPVSMFDLEFLTPCTKPMLFLAGDRDQFCSTSALAQAVAVLPGDPVVDWLPGADHFFSGRERDVADAVVRFLSEL